MNNNMDINDDDDETIYPDALSAAGIVLFVLGITLCSWLIAQSV